MKIIGPLSALLSRILLALLLLAAVERRALAYTDPGTGALILQGIFAAIAGFFFQFRRIKGWLRSRGGPKT